MRATVRASDCRLIFALGSGFAETKSSLWGQMGINYVMAIPGPLRDRHSRILFAGSHGLILSTLRNGIGYSRGINSFLG